MSEIITIFNVVMWAIGMITTFTAALCIAFYAYQHHLERKHAHKKSAQEECCAQEGKCVVCIETCNLAEEKECWE